MKLLYASLLLCSISACKPDKDAGPAIIVGRWQLTSVECYCVPSPTPNVAVEFKADGSVVFYKDNKEEARGTYAFTTGKTPCSPNDVPVLELKTSSAFPSGSPAYTIKPSELVIDYGLCVDLFRMTYRRD
ncbi:lipocalin family protein [Hymenobacter sp. YC55]|uniref:lipocalin family protein n=1 Tax=Hymenobacter sp. YC55 TaxID=3034019 RepID=UPI0023F76F7E|nr:lipocalin family protein [Hymenobacter sp. YC55]MDF7810299.1 lipocalin family protein [Hymenobacter sp. YC55]